MQQFEQTYTAITKAKENTQTSWKLEAEGATLGTVSAVNKGQTERYKAEAVMHGVLRELGTFRSKEKAESAVILWASI